MKTNLTNQWINVYFLALKKSWTDIPFVQELLTQPRTALATAFQFEYPPTLELRFKMVTDGNFANLPEFPVCIFSLPADQVNEILVPLVPPPTAGEGQLDYLQRLQAGPECCCMCF
ncbi:hypothetical protein ACE38W_02460 [Chitinophaga sp. Hz27]|uniref:hypothetical protein n=1 Tax=Chitinophaga sp. Hz27 TaxID=3347169 RepID=UPI0035E22BD9